MAATEFAALRKLSSQLMTNGEVKYQLNLGEQKVALNDLVGQPISLRFQGDIYCLHCQKSTKKSYSQGFCFPCSQKLAQCDMCLMKPETCHFHQGTCREPSWGERHCMIGHYVYLANTSGIKVGITRNTQIPTRWIDQGATQALPLFYVKSRLVSGLVEVALADLIADKTNWRAMLKSSSEPIDLKAEAKALVEQINQRLVAIKAEHGEDSVELLDEEVVDLQYPVLQYPDKITSFNFDKTPCVSGILQGVKGQYLLLDIGVINIRKFSGYHVSFESA